MKTLLSLIGVLLVTSNLAVADGTNTLITLWPKVAPSETGPVGDEHDVTTEKDRTVQGARVSRITDVSNPTLTVYAPTKDKATGAAVIVCPGGGYGILAIDLEGTEVCEWLNKIGVTAFLLKYRVPTRHGDDDHKLPLQDAQRALSVVRTRAIEWGLQTNRIGIMGFSAGGHLAAHASTAFAERQYDGIDDADQTSCRPDFALLVYPAYLAQSPAKTNLPAEILVNKQTSPAFLVQTEDDPIGVECSLVYFRALKDNKVPVEMHLYPKGGHGYGLRPSIEDVTSWPKRAEEWMRSRGLLN